MVPGAAYHTAPFPCLPKHPFQPLIISLTKRGITHDTPNKEYTIGHSSHIWCHCTVKKQWITSSPHFFTNEAPCHHIYDINSHNNVLLAIGNFSCCWYAFILDWFQCFICTEFVQYICLYWCDHMTKWYSMYIIWEAWQFVKRWQMRSLLSFIAEND